MPNTDYMLTFFAKEEAHADIRTALYPQKSLGEIGGGVKSVEGVISTRRGNAGSWVVMIRQVSCRLVWQLMLPNTEGGQKMVR